MRLMLAALVAAFSFSSQAAPRVLPVWTEVEFDAQGQAVSLRFVDEKNYSEGFMAGLRERVLRLHVPPLRPARLRSGLRLEVEIDEATERAQVRLAGMRFEPLVLRRDVAPLPDVHENFDKTYAVDCEIDGAGECSVTAIETEGPVEELPRRWVLATMKLWRFQPPTLDGQPMPSRTRVALRLLGTPEAETRPHDFRLGTKMSRLPSAR